MPDLGSEPRPYVNKPAHYLDHGDLNMNKSYLPRAVYKIGEPPPDPLTYVYVLTSTIRVTYPQIKFYWS